jgi:hypothetical protein
MNVFSFCLYGPENPKYYVGIFENVDLAATHFPDWKVYIYYAPDVPEETVAALGRHSNVVLRPTGINGEENTIHRFYAIDEPEVDLMLVRDADSRIHWKDRWAIHEFLAKPEFIAHGIRDHVMHTADLLAGLWGLRKSAGLCMREEYASYAAFSKPTYKFGHDQNFLGDILYPKVRSRLLVHYSNGQSRSDDNAVEFPFVWTNDIYCGRVELEDISPPKRQPAPPAPPPQPDSTPLILKFLHRK